MPVRLALIAAAASLALAGPVAAKTAHPAHETVSKASADNSADQLNGVSLDDAKKGTPYTPSSAPAPAATPAKDAHGKKAVKS